MQVLFKSRHPQAAELRDLAERRVRFVLRRLGARAARRGADVRRERPPRRRRQAVPGRAADRWRRLGGRCVGRERLAHRARRRAGERGAHPPAPVAPRKRCPPHAPTIHRPRRLNHPNRNRTPHHEHHEAHPLDHRPGLRSPGRRRLGDDHPGWRHPPGVPQHLRAAVDDAAVQRGRGRLASWPGSCRRRRGADAGGLLRLAVRRLPPAQQRLGLAGCLCTHRFHGLLARAHADAGAGAHRAARRW